MVFVYRPLLELSLCKGIFLFVGSHQSVCQKHQVASSAVGNATRTACPNGKPLHSIVCMAKNDTRPLATHNGFIFNFSHAPYSMVRSAPLPKHFITCTGLSFVQMIFPSLMVPNLQVILKSSFGLSMLTPLRVLNQPDTGHLLPVILQRPFQILLITPLFFR